MYPPTKIKTRLANDLLNGAYTIFCVLLFFLIFFLKAYILGTHLNCIDISMQFKEVPTTCAFIKKYTIWNLKTTELLDCVLIGVCGIIRSNKVIQTFFQKTLKHF